MCLRHTPNTYEVIVLNNQIQYLSLSFPVSLGRQVRLDLTFTRVSPLITQLSSTRSALFVRRRGVLR